MLLKFCFFIIFHGVTSKVTRIVHSELDFHLDTQFLTASLLICKHKLVDELIQGLQAHTINEHSQNIMAHQVSLVFILLMCLGQCNLITLVMTPYRAILDPKFLSYIKKINYVLFFKTTTVFYLFSHF